MWLKSLLLLDWPHSEHEASPVIIHSLYHSIPLSTSPHKSIHSNMFNMAATVKHWSLYYQTLSPSSSEALILDLVCVSTDERQGLASHAAGWSHTAKLQAHTAKLEATECLLGSAFLSMVPGA